MSEISELIEARIDRVLTQYRESPNLLGLVREDLRHCAEILCEISDLPEKFDLNDCVGDQLTLLGKRLGWPRCHCVCESQTFFGFECPDTNSFYDISGFCSDNTWRDCATPGTTEICISDDSMYRGFLWARCYQILQRYEIDNLQIALQYIWGGNAVVHDLGGAEICLSPGRVLSDLEKRFLPIVYRVLPIAPGISAHFCKSENIPFGFGNGWGGFCENAPFLCPTPIDPYGCDNEIN